MKKVISSQVSISINSYTELSKAQFLAVSIVKGYICIKVLFGFSGVI